MDLGTILIGIWPLHISSVHCDVTSHSFLIDIVFFRFPVLVWLTGKKVTWDQYTVFSGGTLVQGGESYFLETGY